MSSSSRKDAIPIVFRVKLLKTDATSALESICTVAPISTDTDMSLFKIFSISTQNIYQLNMNKITQKLIVQQDYYNGKRFVWKPKLKKIPKSGAQYHTFLYKRLFFFKHHSNKYIFIYNCKMSNICWFDSYYVIIFCSFDFYTSSHFVK